MASRMSDNEIRKIGESVALGLKDTLRDICGTSAPQRHSKRATAPAKPQQASEYSMRHAADHPCYLCYCFGHTGRHHDLPKKWPDEVDNRWKTVRKKWTIIKEQCKDVNDEEISYYDGAKVHNVNTATWPTVPQRLGW